MTKTNTYRYRVPTIDARRGQIVELADSERTRQLLQGRVIEPAAVHSPDPKGKPKVPPKAPSKPSAWGGGATPADGNPGEEIETK